MEAGPKAFVLSVIAIGISLVSALFAGLQWNEARLARHAEETSADRERELSEAQIMEAERANLLAQRKLNPQFAKNETDLPRITAFRFFGFRIMPLLGKPYDPIEDFLSFKEKSVVIANEGGSTAYDVSARNIASVEEKREGGVFPARYAEDHTMLAPRNSLTLPAEEKEITPQDLQAFRNSEASFYISGGVQYRDAFHRLKTNVWCYEFTVKKAFRSRELEERLCDLGNSGPLHLSRIERDKPDKGK